VSAPEAGSNDVPIQITATDGTIIDGNGAVTVISGLAPLQTTLPALTTEGVILVDAQFDALVEAMSNQLTARGLGDLVTDKQLSSLARLLTGKKFATTPELTSAITGATGITNPDVLGAITTGLATLGEATEIVATEVKQWLYVVTTPDHPPQLQLSANAPTSLMTIPTDVADAIRDPSGGPSIPGGADCATATADAWAAFAEVPCVSTNGNTWVCLGTVGVSGPAGWVSPDDREQIAPPSVVAAWWRSQRQLTYDKQKAACLAGELTVTSLNVGTPTGVALDGQSLLGATDRSLAVTLSDVVRGASQTVVFQSSAGVTVHGPLTIPPGQSSGSISFSIADATGPQWITAQIDPTHQLRASFSSVQLQPPSAFGATAVIPGETPSLGVTLTGAVTEALTVTLSSSNSPLTATFGISPNSNSSSQELTIPTVQGPTLELTASVLGVTRSAQIPVLSILSLQSSDGTSLDHATISDTVQAFVVLSGPCPHPIDITLGSTNADLLQVSPQVPVAAGSSHSEVFSLDPGARGLRQGGIVQVSATFEQMTLTVSVRVVFAL
jgi:hypothetical protein